jgi:outer membrane lipoprotein-sorting protein
MLKMKKLAACLLLAGFCLSGSALAGARSNDPYAQTRSQRKAQKKQAKAQKKYYKAQRKASNKMFKQSQKKSTPPRRSF